MKSRLNLNGRRDSRFQIYCTTVGYLSNYCDRGKMDVNFTWCFLKSRLNLNDRRDRRFQVCGKTEGYVSNCCDRGKWTLTLRWEN